MDDQKIQLESRQDYEFVRSNFLNYIKEMKDCNKFSMEEIEVFDIVKANIQINGEDFDENANNLDMEPIDDSLEAKLQELQNETDNLLVEVTRYRKRYPEIAAKNYSLTLDKCLQNIDVQLESLATGAAQVNCPPRHELPDGLMIDFSFKMEKLAQLQSSIPEIVAKLQRARKVLKDEGTRVMKSSSDDTTMSDNMTENLSELINSQRRVEKQLDLANKIRLAF